MTVIRLFRIGNSQVVRIPAELAFPTSDLELVIERVGEELHIRPVRRRIGNVLHALASFSQDFMSSGEGSQEQADRKAFR